MASKAYAGVDIEELEGIAEIGTYRNIFKAVQSNSGINTRDLREKAGCSLKTLIKDVNDLRNLKLIIIRGERTKGHTYYRVDSKEAAAFLEIIGRIESGSMPYENLASREK